MENSKIFKRSGGTRKMQPNKFKKDRLSLKLTQKALAEKLGIHPQSISDIERGKKKVSRRLKKCFEMLINLMS